MTRTLVASVVVCASQFAALACQASPPMKAVATFPKNSPTKPVSPWPMPVRVLAWTANGLMQVGRWPDDPPTSIPTTPWMVEPIGVVDQAMLQKLAVALRSEHVPGISLQNQPIEDLTALANLPELRFLNIEDTEIATAQLTVLAPLQRLYASNTTITDADIAAVVVAHPELEVVSLEDCLVSNAAITSLTSLAQLRALNLSGTNIDDRGGALLGALQQLQILQLSRTKVSAKTIAAIRPLALRRLELAATMVGREVATLGEFAPGLVAFDIDDLINYEATDRDLSWLSKAPMLEEIGLSSSLASDKTTMPIVLRGKLTRAHLAATNVSVATLKLLVTNAGLRDIDLAGTPLDNATAAALLAMPTMTTLRFDNTSIDDEAFININVSREMTSLFLSNTAVSDQAMSILDQLPTLQALGLGSTHISDVTLSKIAMLSDLRTLILDGTWVTAPGIAKLHQLRNIERLYLSDSAADDSSLQALSANQKMRILHANGTAVTSASIPVLQKWHRLTELAVGHTGIEPQAIELSSWPGLHTLSLVGLPVTDVDLARLPSATMLQKLDLSGTNVVNLSPLLALPQLQILGLVHTALSPAGKAAVKTLRKRGVIVKD
jgi:Leucine-rich repeat (LRR) protein